MFVVQSLQSLWQPASGDIYIYIAIYLGDRDGGIPNCLLAIRVGAVKSIGSIIAFGLPSDQG